MPSQCRKSPPTSGALQCPFGLLQADSDLASLKPFSKLVYPGVYRFWAGCHHTGLCFVRANDTEAKIMFFVGPIDPDEGRILDSFLGRHLYLLGKEDERIHVALATRNPYS